LDNHPIGNIDIHMSCFRSIETTEKRGQLPFPFYNSFCYNAKYFGPYGLKGIEVGLIYHLFYMEIINVLK